MARKSPERKVIYKETLSDPGTIPAVQRFPVYVKSCMQLPAQVVFINVVSKNSIVQEEHL